MPMELYTYKVKAVDKVIDGDTLDLSVDLGFMIVVNSRFRMDRYDTPETYRPKNQAELDAGLKCKNYFKSILEKYSTKLFVKSSKIEIYGRWGATMYYEDENKNLVCINDLMIKYMNDNHLNKADLL